MITVIARLLASRAGLPIWGVIAVAATLASPLIKSFDPPAGCVGNERALITALRQYVQDNDGYFPPMTSQPAFRAALTAYVPDSRIFICPDTGQPYVPNATFDHVWAGDQAFTGGFDWSTAPVILDAVPHQDGVKTLGYYDNIITRGGVEQGDPDKLCVQRMRVLSLAVAQYVQDNDERFPPMQNPTIFRGAVRPYLKDSRLFACPATGELFVPNYKLTYVSLASIANPAATLMLIDHSPHKDGIQTRAYADGHVTHGNINPSPPSAGACNSNEKQIGFALQQYMQDWDEQLPPMDTNARFDNALLPYTRNQNVFLCPDTGKHYVINNSLSFQSLASFGSPGTTEVLHDPNLNNDGTFNTLYLNGHVDQRPGLVPKSLSIAPNNRCVLVWQRTGNSALVNVLNSVGTVLSSASFNAPGPLAAGTCDPNLRRLSAAVMQYAQDHDDGLPPMDTSRFTHAMAHYLGSSTSAICPETGAPYKMNQSLSFQKVSFFNPTFTPMAMDAAPNSDASENTLYLDGHVTTGHASIHPPSYGMTPNSAMIASSGYVGLLWNGTLPRFWVLTPTLHYQGGAAFGPYDGWNLVDQGVGGDQLLRLLWVKYDGTASVWSTAADAYSSDVRIAPIPGKSAVSFAVGQDNLARVLWAGTDNTAVVTTVNTNGSITTSPIYGPYAGYTARQVEVDYNTNITRVLFVNTNGSAALAKVTSGGVAGFTNCTAPAGFTAISAAVGTDGLVRFLFNNSAGGARIYTEKTDGTGLTYVDYNPS